jgi:uncharacterized OB-fold protein
MYVDALATGTVLLPFCLECKRSFFYPRLHCPRCFGDQIRLTPLKRPLRIRSFTWVWRPQSRVLPASLPVLMMAADSDSMCLLAEGKGWGETDPPAIGETVGLQVADGTGSQPVPFFVRKEL